MYSKKSFGFINIAHISHPSVSDIEMGMNLPENYAKYISQAFSKLYEGELVSFVCFDNGIEKSIVVISDNYTSELLFVENKKGKNISFKVIKTKDESFIMLIEKSCMKYKEFKSVFLNTLNTPLNEFKY